MTIDEPFHTLAGLADSEVVVDRSRFLGRAQPVSTLEEALAIVDGLRREHYDARHVCFGLRIGRGAHTIDRSNDDGEPSRTGGFPLWQLLDGDDVTDAIITVVRYFGGVKLGTGGLARAYRAAGREAMDAAGTQTIWPEVILRLSIGYETVGKVEHALDGLEAVRMVDKTFAADVTLNLAIRRVELDAVQARLGELLQRDPASFDVSEE